MSQENVKSKGKWGKQRLPTRQEAEAHAKDYFSNLIVPKMWRLIGSNDICDTDDFGRERLLSNGLVFQDKKDNKIYRVWVNAFSGMGGICLKFNNESDEPLYKSIIRNRVVEKINEFIAYL